MIFVSMLLLFFSISLTAQGLPQPIIFLHLSPSSPRTPTNLTLHTHTSLLSAHPPVLMSASSYLDILLSIYLFIILSSSTSKPSQSGLSGTIFKTSTIHSPSDCLIPDAVYSGHYQTEAQHFNLCCLRVVCS